ncbi:ACT domain-containing protein [Acetivibrio straminisolvens]|jgi:chorismate mutase|uniref:ACT domain-containing protein n=1 Tax=Acetivibrio straminisolvens TaxID=253314 RepID=UPI00223FC7C2|nr:ACT domain-containing protein [Acetivibrio straminisolvens]
MKKASKYYLVDASVLPEVFLKVVEAKKILSSGAIKNVNEAVRKVGISRSAYYKYKDYIFPFYETSQGKVITLFFTVEDYAGILSSIINRIADSKANIITINQNIPINGLADVTITIETGQMIREIKDLLDDISSIEGVKRQEILARE